MGVAVLTAIAAVSTLREEAAPLLALPVSGETANPPHHCLEDEPRGSITVRFEERGCFKHLTSNWELHWGEGGSWVLRDDPVSPIRAVDVRTARALARGIARVLVESEEPPAGWSTSTLQAQVSWSCATMMGDARLRGYRRGKGEGRERVFQLEALLREYPPVVEELAHVIEVPARRFSMGLLDPLW